MPRAKNPTAEQKARYALRDRINAEKKKEAAVTPQQKAIHNLAKNEKVPVLPAGFCNTLNLAFRHVGGIEAMIDLCLYCAGESEEASRMVLLWRETIVDDRPKLIPEEMCRICDIQPAKLLGILASQAFQRNIDMSKMIMALHTPAVIQATAEFAQKSEGHQDRKMLLQAAGVVPTGGKGGIAINVNNVNQQNNSDDSGMPDFAADCILLTSD